MSAYRARTRVVFVSIALALVLPVAISPTATAAAKKKADLRVTAVSASPTTVAGSGLEVTAATKNLGRRRAPGSKTGFLLSRDGRRDKGDLALDGNRAVPKLKPRGKSSGGAQLRVPATTQAGPYHLLACADIAGRIKEANESNNCRAAASLVDVVASKPTAGGAPQSNNPPPPPEEVPPPTGPVLGAFRFTDLDLRDPHIYVDLGLITADITDTFAFGQSLNGGLQESLSTDGDEDGFLDLSPVNLFEPLDQEAATTPAKIDPGARCTAPPQEVVCEPLIPIATTANNSSTGTCLDVLTGTTTASYSPEVATPTAPCFATDEMTLTFDLAGIPLTLQGVQIAASYVGNPATAEANGLIRGFISEADADAIILPVDLPVVGGDPLSKLLPGGTENPAGHDDRDVREGVTGWWFYLNFVATRTPWEP
jgi:CARDB